MQTADNFSPVPSRRTVLLRRLRDDSGVAAIEFALTVPLLIILAIGVIDIGNMLLKYRHAFQAAASIAETSTRLSIANRKSEAQTAGEDSGDDDRYEKEYSKKQRREREEKQQAINTITQEQAALLENGVQMILGEADTSGFSAAARRVVRSKGTLTIDWDWRYGLAGTQKTAFPLNQNEIMGLTKDGESIVVVDVAFDYKFLFYQTFGLSKRLTAHYTAGVPSY